ncbi:MAG: Ig-like domain-containing protein [Chitinophagaceae bacterium]|nr:Ig-like domain-containing protein [Chitinophagaceae bacterium]
MKKIYLALSCMIMYCSILDAQSNYSYTQIVDSALFPVSKTQITTGVLYDRAFPIAGLHVFKSTDTSFFWHFYQAYSELYNATYNKNGLTPVKRIDSIAQSSYAVNGIVPVGILYYDFNVLDTNAIVNNLFYRGADSLLHDVTGRTGNPYLLKNITIAAALAKDTLDYGNGSFKFKFDSQLFLKNKAVTITSLNADFGSGNQNITSGNVLTVTYTSSGMKTIKFTVTYSNAQTATAYAKIFIKSNISSRYGAPVPPNETRTITDTQYGYQGYGETAKKYNSGKYGIYYHRNTPDGPIETIIKKPIIIVDGFDPTDDRDVADIYGIYLQYTQTQNLGNELRNLGYDVIILNFPTLIGAGDPRYQGGDFIQRNAFLLVTLIEKINQELTANGSTEKLVVIGPSMGGLVSRYALKWMENNGKNHNTRLWISFDAPHKGANVPIGDQSFIDFESGVSKAAEASRDNKLSSIAAKQMLLHHYLAGTTLPSGAPNFRNNWQTELDNLGYPQNVRRVALINGAINGTTQGTACQNVYKVKVNIHALNALLFFAQIIKVTEGNIWFTGNNGNACQVFKGWLAAPFLSNSKSAAAPSSSKSYDILPGGYYDTQAQLGGSNTPFSSIFDKNYKRSVTTSMGYFGMWTETIAQIDNPNHCFIPTFSALGMDITNKDLSENLYNRDLVCTGETPFQNYYAPLTNQEHITLTAENVAWIKQEIAGNKQMSSVNYAVLYPFVQTSGSDPVCTTATFQINNLPSGSTISWQSSNTSIATISSTGNPATLTRQGTQTGTVTITATITRPCSESKVVMTKTIFIGMTTPGPISWEWNLPPKRVRLTVNAVPNATSYQWYLNNTLKATTSVPQYDLPMAGNVSCGNSYNFGVRAVGSCGTSQISYAGATMPSCDNALSVSPNPASNNIKVELDTDNAATLRSANANTVTSTIQEVVVYDKSGIVRLRKKFSQGGSTQTISLTGLPSDVYTLQVFDGAKWQSKKIIVKH